MHYSLKNQTLAYNMREICPDFDRRLQLAVADAREAGENIVFVSTGRDIVEGEDCTRSEGVCFTISEIVEEPEYNPDAWNLFPDVTPPNGVWMRVKAVLKGSESSAVRIAAYFCNGRWLSNFGKDASIEDYQRREWHIYFRPWED